MGKTDSKACNFRLKNDVRWALEDLAERWACSQTAVVERAVLESHGTGVDLSVVPAASGMDALREIVAGAIPGVQLGAGSLPKNAKCDHCGQRFAGSKYARICRACEDAGHTNTLPAECRSCQEGFAA